MDNNCQANPLENLAIGSIAAVATVSLHDTLARRAEAVDLPDAIQLITLTADRFALVESTGYKAERYRCLLMS